LAYPPKTDRIKTGDHDPTLSSQDTVDLSQDLMGILREFEQMWQNYQVQRPRFKGQFLGALDPDGTFTIRLHRIHDRRLWERGAKDAKWHPTLAQGRHSG
jgi:hypothetical protein